VKQSLLETEQSLQKIQKSLTTLKASVLRNNILIGGASLTVGFIIGFVVATFVQ
jgi:uncharacterized membrane protein